jgi:hypothetical protein
VLVFILFFLVLQKAHESKSVQTAAGKQLDGIESVGASNKKQMFEQKVRFVYLMRFLADFVFFARLKKRRV